MKAVRRNVWMLGQGLGRLGRLGVISGTCHVGAHARTLCKTLKRVLGCQRALCTTAGHFVGTGRVGRGAEPSSANRRAHPGDTLREELASMRLACTTDKGVLRTPQTIGRSNF
eukprot:3200557-Amphidinium_carterae.1